MKHFILLRDKAGRLYIPRLGSVISGIKQTGWRNYNSAEKRLSDVRLIEENHERVIMQFVDYEDMEIHVRKNNREIRNAQGFL